MSRVLRRTAALAGAAALAVGITLGTASEASAYDYSYTLSASEVAEKRDMMNNGLFACGFLPGFAAAACSGGEMGDMLDKAWYNDCGLTVYVTLTGSGMSYDKASYDYALSC